MSIALIYARDESGGIGFKGKLPWPRIQKDMARFKELTLGTPIIMGRKTFESLPGPLPGRVNVVISRKHYFGHGGDGGPPVTTFDDLEGALRYYSSRDIDVFVIGGGEIYKQALPYAVKAYETYVTGVYPSDTLWAPDLTSWGDPVIETVMDGPFISCLFLDYTREIPEKTL